VANFSDKPRFKGGFKAYYSNNYALTLILGRSTEAINLDGGGSSCMLINGKETIIPSDGKQRTITNMVAIY